MIPTREPAGTGDAFRVLIADDDDISRKRLQSVLKKRGYDVVAAVDGQEAWNLLDADDAPRLAILDWMMPHLDGAEICRRLRAQKREPYTYVMLLTGKDAKEDLIAGLEAGADDYLAKPFYTQELEVRLRAGRRIVELQRELIAAREAMRFQAMHDRLTGVCNRGAMDEVLAREIARARRSGSPIAVAMVDLDFFKKVNDTHGHAAGDAVLKAAAARFCASLRAYDVLGRFGGEEFLAVFPGCAVESAVTVAERLRAALAATPVEIEGGAIACTCSVGVCAGALPHELDADALLAAADKALYEAKRAGRNRVVSGRVEVASAAATERPSDVLPASREVEQRAVSVGQAVEAG